MSRLLEMGAILLWVCLQAKLTQLLLAAFPTHSVRNRYSSAVWMRVCAPVPFDWMRIADGRDREQFTVFRRRLLLWQAAFTVFVILFVLYVAWLTLRVVS
jgi:hypothetical protein